MVPHVVRLDEAGVCGCGQVVAAGERAGTTRQPGVVVCLACVAAISADPDGVIADDEPLPSDAAAADTGAAEADSVPDTAADSVPDAPADGQLEAIPAPVAVLIPADWGPSSPTSLPSWQREAGITVTLPPAAPVSTRPVPAPAPAVAIQIAPHGTVLEQPEPVAAAPEPLPAPEAVPAPAAARAPRSVPGPAVVPEPALPPSPATPEPVPAPVVATAPHTAAPPVVEVLAPPEAVPVADDEAAVTEAVAMPVPSHRRRTILPAGLLALRSSRGREPGVTGQSDPATRAVLDSATEGGVLALHDRRMPGRRGRIAHLAFGAGGVYVIDVVRAKNASVEVRVLDELDHATHELVVDGRPMSTTVSATQGRVAIVRALLDEVDLTTVPVIGVMCFVDAAVPTDGELAVAGVHVTGRVGLPALVQSDGALEPDHRETLREYLTERLPAA